MKTSSAAIKRIVYVRFMENHLFSLEIAFVIRLCVPAYLKNEKYRIERACTKGARRDLEVSIGALRTFMRGAIPLVI